MVVILSAYHTQLKVVKREIINIHKLLKIKKIPLFIRDSVVDQQGLEPWTHWLRVNCSTNWATGPYYKFFTNKHLKTPKDAIKPLYIKGVVGTRPTIKESVALPTELKVLFCTYTIIWYFLILSSKFKKLNIKSCFK